MRDPGQLGDTVSGYYRAYCYMPLLFLIGRHPVLVRMRSAGRDGAAGVEEDPAWLLDRLRAAFSRLRLVPTGRFRRMHRRKNGGQRSRLSATSDCWPCNLQLDGYTRHMNSLNRFAPLLLAAFVVAGCAARPTPNVVRPDRPPGHYSLVSEATAKFDTGEFEAAAKIFNQAAHAAPSRTRRIRAWQNAAWSQLLANNRAEFLRSLDRLCSAGLSPRGQPGQIGTNGEELSELFSIPAAYGWTTQARCPRSAPR